MDRQRLLELAGVLPMSAPGSAELRQEPQGEESYGQEPQGEEPNLDDDTGVLGQIEQLVNGDVGDAESVLAQIRELLGQQGEEPGMDYEDDQAGGMEAGMDQSELRI